MTSILHAFYAESLLLLRSRGALSMFIVGILFYSILYPVPYGHETPQKLPFFAIDQDESTSSRTLLRTIGATEGVLLQHGDDVPAAMEALRAGNIAGVLLVPRDFERKLLAGREQSIPLYCDAAHLLLYRMVLQSVRQAVETLGAGVRVMRMEKQGMPDEAALQLQTRGRPDIRLMYNPAGNYARNTVPPVFVLILQQILLSGCAMLEVKRRSLGMEEKGLLGLLGRCLLPVALSLFFAVYYFRILGVWDDLTPTLRFGEVIIFLLPFFFAATALGNLLGRFFQEESQVMPVILPLSLPMLFLSGFVWPPEAMPPFFRVLAQIIPDTPAISGYLLMAVRGAGFDEVRALWLQLWALAALFFALARAVAVVQGRKGIC